MAPDNLAVRLEKAEAEARKLRDQLDRITTITSGIIYIVDPKGFFTYINKAVEDLLGYEPEELIGEHFSCLMENEEFLKVGRTHVLPGLRGMVTGAGNAPRLFDERRTGERCTRHLEVKLCGRTDKDRRILAGEVTGILGAEGGYDLARSDIQNGEEAFLGSQGIIYDITKYKIAEKQRDAILCHAYELQKMEAIGRLAGGIAKDFSSNLLDILNYADLIGHPHEGQSLELVRYSQQLRTSARRMLGIAEKLQVFSRVGNRNMAAIDMNAMVTNVKQILESIVPEHTRVVLESRPGKSIVLGDEGQLRNALLNMAFNACDAMPEGGVLTFAVDTVECSKTFVETIDPGAQPGKYICVKVCDTGMGMDEEMKSHIFEPFFSTKSTGTGIGMGLAGVHGCVREHMGMIDVTSAPGKGATLSIYLPSCVPNTPDTRD